MTIATFVASFDIKMSPFLVVVLDERYHRPCSPKDKVGCHADEGNRGEEGRVRVENGSDRSPTERLLMRNIEVAR